jgi:glucose-6-phosphate dehydrogenase assembly protein OpcA
MVTTVSEIAVPNIRVELDKLWNDEQGQDKIRATLFNLIVYVQDKKKIKEYELMIQKVISKFPSRVIFIIADVDPEDRLDISVSSQTLGEGELKIFCEMIRLQASGPSLARLPFLVIPHILADLPVYLLWAEDPSVNNGLLTTLQPYVTRIIFNAHTTAHLQSYCSTILAMIHRYHCEVGDLNWDALEGWRRILTETFNEKEPFLVLGQAHHLSITYNKPQGSSDPECEIQAAYLQAWLACRLNWNLESFEEVEGNLRLGYRRPMNEVIVFLRPDNDPLLPPGAILGLEIKSSKDDAHYLFSRSKDGSEVTIQHSTQEACFLPITTFLSNFLPGQEIVQEIFYPKGKEHYKQMLTLLSQTSWRNH